MDAKDKGTCGGFIDYNNEVYDEDCFGDILNILDLPVETLEGDALTEDWASKLGPIPSEVFKELLPPATHAGIGNGGGSSADLITEFGAINVETCQPNGQRISHEEALKSRLKPQHPKFVEQKFLYPLPRSFEAPSPDSVLERRSSTSASKTNSFRTEMHFPLKTKTRSRRSRSKSNNNPWTRSPISVPLRSEKKKKRRILSPSQPVNETKKCSHCEITKTPQWREGPMGPKTLCNACGVRYRSGRLFPEYRPAASPTFIPALHSNSHRKVIEMRQKGVRLEDNYVVNKDSSLNPTYISSRLCSS